MTEEPHKTEQPAPEKLLIDDPMNFPFHAAYLVYSDIFDKPHRPTQKKRLMVTSRHLSKTKSI